MNIAILGSGFMGKKHKSLLEKMSDVHSILEIDHISEIENNNHFSSIEEFLERKPESNLVVVSTPNHLHFSHALQLLENGYHVLIEKPFCFRTEEAFQLRKAAEKTNSKVFLVMQNRFSTVTEFLKNLIKNNTLGRIYNIQFNAFWNRGKSYYKNGSWKGKKEQDGGILYTQFSHLVDLLLYVFGEKQQLLFKDLQSFRNYTISEIEDTAIVFLESESGFKSVINFSTAVFEKNEETSLNIIAEKGTLKISGQYFDEITYQNIQGIDKVINLSKTSNEDNLEKMYHEIFKNLKSQSNNAIVLEDGISLVQLLEEIYS